MRDKHPMQAHPQLRRLRHGAMAKPPSLLESGKRNQIGTHTPIARLHQPRRINLPCYLSHEQSSSSVGRW